MLSTTLSSMRNVLGFQTRPNRRVAKQRGNWGVETERIETRALLSATTARGAAVAAEVSGTDAHASFEYPNVGGQWHVMGQDIEGDVTMTQTKNKVVSDIPNKGLSVQVTGKFTKAHSDEIYGSTRVTNPLGGGKLKVRFHIHFLTDTTFSGEVHVPSLGMSIDITGTKSPIIGAVAVAKTERTAPMYPDVSGMWDGSAEAPGIGVLQGTLDVQQHKGKISATADLGDGIAISLKGKINRYDFSLVKGRARITMALPGFTKVKAPFEVQLNGTYTEFSGVAHSSLGDITLHANRQP